MPNFDRHGYDKHLDLTEDEWLEQQMYDSFGEDEYYNPLLDTDVTQDAMEYELEGEPYEDEYFHGIPDEDIFGRKSWEMED